MSTWTKRHERCVVCKTTTVRHGGHGLCRSCYSYAYYRATKGAFFQLASEEQASLLEQRRAELMQR